MFVLMKYKYFRTKNELDNSGYEIYRNISNQTYIMMTCFTFGVCVPLHNYHTGMLRGRLKNRGDCGMRSYLESKRRLVLHITDVSCEYIDSSECELDSYV